MLSEYIGMRTSAIKDHFHISDDIHKQPIVANMAFPKSSPLAM